MGFKVQNAWTVSKYKIITSKQPRAIKKGEKKKLSKIGERWEDGWERERERQRQTEREKETNRQRSTSTDSVVHAQKHKQQLTHIQAYLVCQRNEQKKKHPLKHILI